ncbi:Fusaric acid cluster transcription factor fub12 [Fusarium equiseti]|uniref:Fusaric acid cluster transcription factor fub12 n=1 Tax=Fusarium equiseti TaxID=61235 RepID=A0ABQ8QYV8_FUSEQ|nr:Fusaric acid cluster transcription factor fub12 [Fusarium equiseti]
MSTISVSGTDTPKNRDIFHFFVNTQNLRLLVTAPPIEPLTEDDWETEDSQEASDLFSPTTHQQKVSLIAHCELAQIFGGLTSAFTSGSSQNLQRLIEPLDSWRTSLPARMKSDDAGLEGEMYYSEALTTSYRFECIMCRLLRRGRWPVKDETVREWAKERFRAATLELDSILKRVLMGDTIRKMPTTFITTITALLALHIESALDPSESDLVRSMARISIQYTMLALNQIQDTPAIKRALPAFEMVLSKNKLYPASVGDIAESEAPRDNTVDKSIEVATLQDPSFSREEDETLPFLGGDFSGFEFFDRWQMEQLDFTGIY